MNGFTVCVLLPIRGYMLSTAASCFFFNHSFPLTSSSISSRPCVLDMRTSQGRIRGVRPTSKMASWGAGVDSTRTATEGLKRVDEEYEAQILLSTDPASDCPSRLGVLHLCFHSFAFDLVSIWQSSFHSSPLSVIPPSPLAPLLGISGGAH